MSDIPDSQGPQEPIDPTLEEWVVPPIEPSKDPEIRDREKIARIFGSLSTPDDLTELLIDDQVEEVGAVLEARLLLPHVTPKPGFKIEFEMLTGLGGYRETTDEGYASYVSNLLPEDPNLRHYETDDGDSLLEVQEIFEAVNSVSDLPNTTGKYEGPTVGENPAAAHHKVILHHKSKASVAGEDGEDSGGVITAKVGKPPTDPAEAEEMNTRYFDTKEELVEYIQTIVNEVDYDQVGSIFFDTATQMGTYVAGKDHLKALRSLG